ncbi:hypothetical protein CLF_106439 [Clonorchis sinensis]|uniref:Thioredoxin domain-containing protein n=1 Tax=Clonorchis sinensis TaxID=79923 RepID=G7YF59_CLOSI|nr:hypothetical protein CLF_106439 [Clonorchis sinensis]
MHERKEQFADSVEQVEQYTKDALNCQLRVYAFFIGTTDPETGDSWCPDCRTVGSYPVHRACQLVCKRFVIMRKGIDNARAYPNRPIRIRRPPAVTGSPSSPPSSQLVNLERPIFV